MVGKGGMGGSCLGGLCPTFSLDGSRPECMIDGVACRSVIGLYSAGLEAPRLNHLRDEDEGLSNEEGTGLEQSTKLNAARAKCLYVSLLR